MSDIKLSPMARLIVAGAKARFGEIRWQSPLAEVAGVSPATIQKLVSKSDQREVTPKTALACGMALLVEADRLEAQSDKVREIATKILKKLEE